MGGEEDPPPLPLQVQEDGLQLLAAHGVQAQGGLVQEEEAGVEGQGQGEGGLLLHPPGEGGQGGVEAVQEAKARQPGLKPGPHLLGGKPPDAPEVEGVGEEGEVHVEVAASLQEDAELVALGPPPPLPLLQDHLAPIGEKEPEDDLDEGGLARPVGPQEAQDLPRGQLQAHPLQGLQLPEALVDVLHQKPHQYLPKRPLRRTTA